MQELIGSLVDFNSVGVNEYHQLLKTVSELLLEAVSDGCFVFVIMISSNYFWTSSSGEGMVAMVLI